MWFQNSIKLPRFSRGFHLITDIIEKSTPEIGQFSVGIAQLFIQHSSASLTINENADPTVRTDMELHFNRFVPENAPYYQHIYEGSDDMPAHIKASILGASVQIPIVNGKLALGIWQGIYLGEHRNSASSRTIVVTLHGE